MDTTGPTQTTNMNRLLALQVQFYKLFNKRKPCSELLARGEELDKCALCKAKRPGCHNEQLLLRTLVANGEFKANDAPPVGPRHWLREAVPEGRTAEVVPTGISNPNQV